MGRAVGSSVGVIAFGSAAAIDPATAAGVLAAMCARLRPGRGVPQGSGVGPLLYKQPGRAAATDGVWRSSVYTVGAAAGLFIALPAAPTPATDGRPLHPPPP